MIMFATAETQLEILLKHGLPFFYALSRPSLISPGGTQKGKQKEKEVNKYWPLLAPHIIPVNTTTTAFITRNSPLSLLLPPQSKVLSPASPF